MNAFDKAIRNCDDKWKDYKVDFTLVELKKVKRTITIRARGPMEAQYYVNMRFRNENQYPTEFNINEVSK